MFYPICFRDEHFLGLPFCSRKVFSRPYLDEHALPLKFIDVTSSCSENFLVLGCSAVL